jgi:hypothetical protein
MCSREEFVSWSFAMRMHRNIVYLVFLIVPALLVFMAGCSFSRTDLLEIATAQPDIHIIPNGTDSYSFNTVEVYEVSKQTFYIENHGTRTLKVEKIYTTSSQQEGFLLDTTYTASNIEPGDSTFFDVYFKPSSDMTVGDSVLIESNDPDERIYQFNISGSGRWGLGTPPMVVVMQGPGTVGFDSVGYDFGPVNAGSSTFIDFTVMNDAAADYDLSVSRITFKSGDIAQFNRIAPVLPNSISPGSGIDFVVEFSPDSAVSFMAEVEIITDDPVYKSFTFWVSGTGREEPDIRLLDGTNEIPTDGTVSFGSVEYNQNEVTRLIAIENTGSVDLSITDILVDDIDGDFFLTSPVPLPDPFTVAPGGQRTFAVTFKPVSGFDKFLQAAIEIYSDDPDESLYLFYVDGYSESIQVPDIAVRNETTGGEVPSLSLGYDFTTVGVGTLETTTFRVENAGNTDLTLYDIYLGGDTGDFYLSNTPFLPVVIPPGNSILFDANYSPTGTGAHIASVHIENDDPDTLESSYSCNLQGKGSVTDVPDIQVNVGLKKVFNNGIYYFNDDKSAVSYPGSIARTFTIENKGKSDLSINGMLLVSDDAEDFTADLVTPAVVKAGSHTDFTIVFDPVKAPSGLEERSTRIQISSNDADESPYKIDLVGYVAP